MNPERVISGQGVIKRIGTIAKEIISLSVAVRLGLSDMEECNSVVIKVLWERMK